MNETTMQLRATWREFHDWLEAYLLGGRLTNFLMEEPRDADVPERRWSYTVGAGREAVRTLTAGPGELTVTLSAGPRNGRQPTDAEARDVRAHVDQLAAEAGRKFGLPAGRGGLPSGKRLREWQKAWKIRRRLEKEHRKAYWKIKRDSARVTYADWLEACRAEGLKFGESTLRKVMKAGEAEEL